MSKDNAMTNIMFRQLFFVWALVAVIPSAAIAQAAPTNNYTSFEATPEKPVQLGYYASAHKNCTPAPLPTISVVEPPKYGMLTVRRGELTTNKIGGCPQMKLAVQVVLYQARTASTGTDHLVYEVTNPTDEVDTYDVKINIDAVPKSPNAPKAIGATQRSENLI